MRIGERLMKSASQMVIILGGAGGIVVQGRQVYRARVRGDEWRDVH
jgi:hypothetical protein